MKKIALVVLIFVAWALVACSGSSTPAVQTISLEAVDVQFGATNFEVVAGRPVQLTLTNSGALDHDFTIAKIPVKDVTMTGEMGGHDMGHMAETPDLHIAVKPGGMAMAASEPVGSKSPAVSVIMFCVTGTPRAMSILALWPITRLRSVIMVSTM